MARHEVMQSEFMLLMGLDFWGYLQCKHYTQTKKGILSSQLLSIRSCKRNMKTFLQQ
ncbi:hypothetical protein [Legionella qingyii]|uniref:hypothetical protein n=1 Tax=Legionella qingyii TaxID=2184757 RepID=UPI001404057F|nr:hypothetical protein [Legionella qingyii]